MGQVSHLKNHPLYKWTVEMVAISSKQEKTYYVKGWKKD